MHVTKSRLIALLLRKERERERIKGQLPSELVFFASGTLFLPDLTDNWKNTNFPFVLKLLLGQNKLKPEIIYKANASFQHVQVKITKKA